MPITDFTIRGAKEMDKLLRELGPRTANRVGDQALRAGAKVIVEEAKRLVSVKTGELRDAITVATEKSRTAGDERIVFIGFKPPVSRRAHLTEYGTSKTPAKPFIRPAMDTRASDALAAIGKVLARGITREANKLAKPVR